MAKYVCEKCVNDPVLAEIVGSNVCSPKCSYCDRQSKKKIACEIDELLPSIRQAIDRIYTDDPREELPYDSEDKCLVGTTLDIGDVLNNLDFCPENHRLFEDICTFFDDECYCERDYYPGSPRERANRAWLYFRGVIQRERRFTFWNDDTEEHWLDISPSKMIRAITSTIEGSGLVDQKPVGTQFWRVRVHNPNEDELESVREFTSVPHEKAFASNRMSPAGIPMFYGSETFRTACLEVVQVNSGSLDDMLATGMCFENTVPLNILDLMAIPQPRSIFEAWEDYRWNDFHFLSDFVDDLSKPIVKDGRQHIEYVPTQVFTEVVRYELKYCGQPIHGIRYPSSHDRQPCVVIFATQDECLPKRCDSAILRPLAKTRKSVPAITVKRWASQSK